MEEMEERKLIYLCKPNGQKYTVLNGIKEDSVSISKNIKDYGSISFDVDKYVFVNGNKIKSNGYDDLHDGMELSFDDSIGYKIQEPETHNDGDLEYKTVTAYTTEKELESKQVNSLQIHTGTTGSMETLASVNKDKTPLAYDFKWCTFWNEDKELSVIDILMDYAPGWSVGHVDDTLKSKEISIDVTDRKLYGLLTSDIAYKARCIFTFDSRNRIINAYDIESFGKNTDIYLSYKNLLNNVDVQCESDNIITRMSVFGSDDLDIRDVNFNSQYIDDFSFYKKQPYMSNQMVLKLDRYEEYKESKRESFSALSVELINLQNQASEIMYRVPSDDLDTAQWESMGLENLQKALNKYEEKLTVLRISVDPNPKYDSSGKYIPRKNADGTIDDIGYYNLLKQQVNGYGGCGTYKEIVEYIIPNINIAIYNLSAIESDKKDYIKDFETKWDLYGIKELEGKKEFYTSAILSEYTKPWSELTEEEKKKFSNAESEYNIYHNKNVEYKNILGSEDKEGTLLYALKQLREEYDAVNTKINDVVTAKNNLINDVAITNSKFGFTEDEIKIYHALTKTDSYKNDNIVATSYMTNEEKLDLKEKLYQDSLLKLSEKSVPQYTFSISMDNPLFLEQFKEKINNFDIGNYIYLEVDGEMLKMRISSISYNPYNMNEDFGIEFTSMITSKGGRSDFTYLLGEENTSGGSSSSSTSSSSSEDSVKVAEILELIKNLKNNSNFGNAVSSCIDDAFLKSGKITSIVSKYVKASHIEANRIDAGKINTTKVEIGSESGNFAIKDNTLQISDGTRVRVQIGKDANGNYDLTLWNENGDILWDARGVTSVGIRDDIIVNDMVSPNAAISGTKLDIDSVIDEVNNSTTHLKASSIHFDEAGQSLDVAFSDLQKRTKDSEDNITVLKSDFTTSNGKLSSVITESSETKKGLSETQKTLDELESKVITKVDVLYVLGDSSVTSPTEGWQTVAPTWKDGKYVWQKTVVEYADGSTKESAPVCISGASGAAGEAGVGVSKIEEYYYKSTSATSLTGGSWSTTSPTWENGKYIWTKSVITYTDGTSSETSPICTTGFKGETGSKGDKGDPGVGVSKIEEYYLATSANTGVTTSTAGWTTTIQTMDSTNKYLWNYEVIKYGDNSSQTGTPKIIGVYGNDGNDGKGIKSITNYYLVTNLYSGVTTSTTGWTTTVQTVTSTNRYLWNYEKIEYTDNSTTITTPCIIGAYGDKGETGDKGDKGDKGDAGVGVSSITEYYLATASSSGVTTSTTGWTTTIQNTDSTKKYLWNYEVIKYTDNSTQTGNPKIIGMFSKDGTNGTNGKGINSVVNYYLATSSYSGVTTSTTGWTTNIQTMTNVKKYLWNYEVVTYTDNTTSTTTPCIIGTYGDKGDKGDKGDSGVGVTSVDVEYYLSTSSTSLNGGSWSTTAPTWVDGKYIWTRNVTKLTDNTTVTSSPVCITGGKGASGSTGTGVESITEEYYLSTSKTTQEGGSWTTTPPTWESGKYIWTRSKIVYKNPTSTVYTTPVCDSSWEAVNEIEVGGRNLLVGSGKYTKDSPFEHCVTDRGDAAFEIYDSLFSVYLENGKTYTISFETNKIPVGDSGNEENVSFWIWKDYSCNEVITKNTGEKVYTIVWTKPTDTYTICLSNYKQGVVSLWWNMQIEEGNKRTSWNVPPEDVEEKITSNTTKISEFTQDLDGFKTYVSETYVDESTVERINSRFEQTDSTIEMAFTRSAEYTNDSLDSVKDKFDALNTYIRFDEEGMEIGKLGSNFKGKFTNDELAFYSGEDKVAYFNNSRMYVPDSAEVQGHLVVSDPLTDQFYRFLVRPNGHLSLIWKGE